MSKRLRKVFNIAVMALMIIGMSTVTLTELHADAARHVKTVKVNHHNNRRDKRTMRKSRYVRNSKIRRRVVKRYQGKTNRMKRASKQNAKPKYKVYRSHFKRSNNRRALRRSGYYDAHIAGANIIFDRYAPNSKRAVVPKKARITYWYQGKFGQKDPIPYYYVSAVHGWMKLR